jgi:DNA polymerase V
MSNRMIALMEELSPRVEQYSIDEIFIDINGIDSNISFEDFGRQLRQHILKGTGLTIGIGGGISKTLAKSASGPPKSGHSLRVF